jgi:large subunit ribosomal protein L17
MQHKKTNRKLGMKTAHRMSMLRNMATSIVVHERIRTTDTRAKEVRRVLEKMITFAKRGDLNARRQAARFIRGNDVLKKLFTEIGPRFQQREGGYTRIIKIGNRHGDNAPMVIIELVEGGEVKKKAGSAAKKSAKKAAAAKTAKQAAPEVEAPAETASAEAPVDEASAAAEETK